MDTMLEEDRAVNRIIKKGASALATYELLEALVGEGIGRELIQSFGSLTALVQAHPLELMGVSGIGLKKAAMVAASLEIGRRAVIEGLGERPTIKGPNDIANVLMAEMKALEQEHLVVLCINAKNQLVHKEVVYKGSVNSAMVRISEIFRMPIKLNACAIAIAHNHPSGDPTPSRADASTTREIVKAGKMLGIEVLDHLVIGCGRFVSMREKGLGFNE